MAKAIGTGAERSLRLLLESVHSLEAKGIPQENITQVDLFSDKMNGNDGTDQERSVRTKIIYIYALNKFLIAMGKTKIKTATKEDIENAFAKLNKLGLSTRNLRDIKTNVKFFYKIMFGDGIYHTPNVAWYKAAKPRKRKLPEDLLSEDDVLNMLNAAKNFRDQAIIALLWDTGARIGELMAVRKKDIELDAEPGHIRVDGKTGMRRIPILFSMPYVLRYIETQKDLTDNDIVWRTQWYARDSPMDSDAGYHAISVMLKSVGKRAGITKLIHPHKFRASRATNLADKVSEQTLKRMFGWTQDSTQMAVYISLNDKSVDTAFMQANGKKPREDTKTKLDGAKICPRCKAQMGMNYLHCFVCGAALDSTIASYEDTIRKDNAQDPDNLDIQKLVADEVAKALLKKKMEK